MISTIQNKITNQTFQATLKPTETLVKVKSLDDSEKTQIVLNPKTKPSPKPGVSKLKGTNRKTNPPKEQHISTDDPTNKEDQDLAKSDKEKRGKQQEGLHIEGNQGITCISLLSIFFFNYQN